MGDLAKMKAGSPFDDLDADIILRSCDDVDFHVYKVVLVLASPFFRDMFSLPQDSTVCAQADGSVPVIDFTEDCVTLGRLLRLCYPVADPIMKELGDLAKVLEAAIKYQMEEATDITRALLLTFVVDKPREVFAIAARLNLEEEASAAAHQWRSKCPTEFSHIVAKGKIADWNSTPAGATFVPEMDGVSAGILFRLLRFIRTGQAPSSFLNPDVKLPSSPDETSVASYDDEEHLFNYPDADIILRSSDGKDFRVHKLILRLASATLIDNASSQKDDLPIIYMEEDSSTLKTLLQIYYPEYNVVLEDLATAQAVLNIAVKYDMKKAIEVAKIRWMRQVSSQPLAVYFAAIRQGWTKEADAAASCACVQHIEEIYVSDMEQASAASYYRLLQFYHKSQEGVAGISCGYEMKSNEDWTLDFSKWWDGRKQPPRISATIVQRELRALSFEVKRRTSYYENIKFSDIADLVQESQVMEEEISAVLDKIKLNTQGPPG